MLQLYEEQVADERIHASRLTSREEMKPHHECGVRPFKKCSYAGIFGR